MEVRFEDKVLVKGTPRRIRDFLSCGAITEELKTPIKKVDLQYPLNVHYLDKDIAIKDIKECKEFLKRLNTNLEKLQLDYIKNALTGYIEGDNINIMYVTVKVEAGIQYFAETQSTVQLYVNYSDIEGVVSKGRGFSSKKDAWDEENKKLIINVYTDKKHTILKGRKMRFTLTDIPSKTRILDMYGNETTKEALGIPKKEKIDYVKPPVKDIYIDKILNIGFKRE